MKKIKLITLFHFVAIVNLSAQNASNLYVIPYVSNCKYGLITEDHKIIVKPQFDYIDYFAGNYFKTECNKDGKHYYGVLSNNGKIILPCKYDEVHTVDKWNLYTNEDLPEGTSIVAEYRGAVQYFSMSGKRFILKEKLNQMGSYAMDNIIICRERFGVFLMEGKYGVLKDRCTFIDPWYDNIKEVRNSKCTETWFIITYNGSSGIKDSKGNFFMRSWYDKIDFVDYSDSREINLFKVTKNNLSGIVDLTGKEIIPPVYKNIQIIKPDSNYLFIVSNDSVINLIDTNNKVQFSFKNCSIENNYSLSGFVITVNESKKKGFLNYNGLSVPREYKNIISVAFSRFVLVEKENGCKFYYDMKTKKELR